MPNLRLFPSRRCLAGLLAAAWLAVLPASAMSVRPPTFAELVAESGRIVRATVTAVEPFETVNAEGKLLVKTRVTWRVETTLKGDAAGEMTLEFLGGRTKQHHAVVPGMPRFTVGETSYVFASANPRTICPLIAAGHGRYFVTRDAATAREYVARDNRVPLTDPAQVVEPLGNAFPAVLAARPPSAGLSPADFETAVRNELNRQVEVHNVR